MDFIQRSSARITRQLFKAFLVNMLPLRSSSTTLNCGTDLLSNCTANSHFYVHHQTAELSFYPPLHRLNFTSLSCYSSSPYSSISHSASGCHSVPGLRDFNRESKTNDGNLKGIVARSSTDTEEFRVSKTETESSYCKCNRSMIHKAPSFSIYDSGCNDEFRDGNQNPEEEMNQEGLERTVTIGDSIEAIDVDGSKLSCGEKSMGLIEEEEEDGIQNIDVKDEVARPVSPPLYLATGLGVDSLSLGFDGDGIDLSRNVEEYYKTMVDVHPFDPLVLRNYAHFLQVRIFYFPQENVLLSRTINYI